MLRRPIWGGVVFPVALKFYEEMLNIAEAVVIN
jgi:hypothetical protein